MQATLPLLEVTDFPEIKRGELQTIQVNLGYVCNQHCVHCHVNASPRRTEIMSREICEQILTYLEHSSVKTLDLTGGAPELNPHFPYMVKQARKLGLRVIDRCNLSILTEKGQENLAEFLAENQVEIVASLPCYLEKNVDKQRGQGVFQKSVLGLRQLNALGYGQENSNLILNLVYNPQNPVLPPPQKRLESDYKTFLYENYKIVFNQLYTLCNMPIQRFGSYLISKGEFEKYVQLLRDSFNNDNLSTVMCRNLISLDWQGYVYDCDFNQILGLPLHWRISKRRHISELQSIDLKGNIITVAEHCYGCTAGQGSSCGGALS